MAIDLLKQGKIKYLSNNSDSDLREDLFENGQHPYAVVITCSDSRVIPEEAFSANFGELFTIRTAGNVVSEFETGSVEYGVEHLGTILVLVLGHTNCGAVTAATEPFDPNAQLDSVSKIVREIMPSVSLAREEFSDKDDVIAKDVELNVANSIARLKQSKVLSDLEKAGKLKIIGGVYNIKTGTVTFAEE